MPVSGNLTDMMEQYYVSHTQATGAAAGAGTTSRFTTVVPAPRPAEPGFLSRTALALLGAALASGAVLLACGTALLVRRGRRKVALLQKHSALASALAMPPPATIGLRELKIGPALPPPADSDSDSELYHEPYRLLPRRERDSGTRSEGSLDYGKSQLIQSFQLSLLYLNCKILTYFHILEQISLNKKYMQLLDIFQMKIKNKIFPL